MRFGYFQINIAVYHIIGFNFDRRQTMKILESHDKSGAVLKSVVNVF